MKFPAGKVRYTFTSEPLGDKVWGARLAVMDFPFREVSSGRTQTVDPQAATHIAHAERQVLPALRSFDAVSSISGLLGTSVPATRPMLLARRHRRPPPTLIARRATTPRLTAFLLRSAQDQVSCRRFERSRRSCEWEARSRRNSRRMSDTPGRFPYNGEADSKGGLREFSLRRPCGRCSWCGLVMDCLQATCVQR